LEKIYQEIGHLEKKEILAREYYKLEMDLKDDD